MYKCCLFVLLLISLGNTGCRKEAAGEPIPADSIGRINRWVLDSMRRYYYWADDIPAGYNYNEPTDQFFKHLLSPKDRFSWISDGQAIPPPSNTYFRYGFQYALVTMSGNERMIGVVTLVNKGGAADLAGMRRGHYFLQVNGTDITALNMKQLNQQLQEGPRVTLTPAVWENNTDWITSPPLTLQSGFAAENPVHYTRSFTASGITTGYLFYNSFDERYDAQLLQAMAKLKQAQVRELILDLRYNAGGSVASSAKLAAMLAGKLTAEDTYAIFAGNRHEGRRPRSLQNILNTSSNEAGKQYAQLLANRVSIQRVFILTTSATLSSAELIINNLKPFMEVIQIGQATAGKDEASFLITDNRLPQQVKWSMQPTIYKLFNKNNQGGYETGIVPAHQVEELASLPLADIGEADDALLGKALQLIYGATGPGSYTVLRQQVNHVPVTLRYHSIQQERAIP
jgi:carboxyl-terminal processing protease